jgi:hypothetical protein
MKTEQAQETRGTEYPTAEFLTELLKGLGYSMQEFPLGSIEKIVKSVCHWAYARAFDRTCKRCGGSGTVSVNMQPPFSDPQEVYFADADCPVCDASGETPVMDNGTWTELHSLRKEVAHYKRAINSLLQSAKEGGASSLIGVIDDMPSIIRGWLAAAQADYETAKAEARESDDPQSHVELLVAMDSDIKAMEAFLENYRQVPQGYTSWRQVAEAALTDVVKLRREVSDLTPNAERMLAASKLLRERRRQQRDHGYDDAHDDQYQGPELALAAACYLLAYAGPDFSTGHVATYWPWDPVHWKPDAENPRRNLEKGGALLLAELERLDRKAATGGVQ